MSDFDTLHSEHEHTHADESGHIHPHGPGHHESADGAEHHDHEHAHDDHDAHSHEHGAEHHT